MHAELTLRGTTVMLGPEITTDGFPGREDSRRHAGNSVSTDGERRQNGCQERNLGAVAKGPVMDMFWGDR
jgi:hypothetical protein